MSDKRSYIRFSMSGDVNMKADSGQPVTFRGDLIDLSFRGFAVNLEKKVDIAVGTVVNFELVSEVWRSPLAAKGRVTNIVEGTKYGNKIFRVGIEFVDADQDTVALLINKIRKRLIEKKRKKDAAKQGELKDYVF